MNLGSGDGYSIRELVETLAEFLDFKYEFDTSRPSGFPRRIMDISLAREMIKYNPETSLCRIKEYNGMVKVDAGEYKNKQNYYVQILN